MFFSDERPDEDDESEEVKKKYISLYFMYYKLYIKYNQNAFFYFLSLSE